jgi:HTH-type transcriptional regulator / antitoxin HipB
MAISANTVRELAVSLRERRRELGLSQAQAAERAGVSREWINKFEAGRSRAELRLVLSLVAALDMRLLLADQEQQSRPAGRAEGQVDLDELLADYQQHG